MKHNSLIQPIHDFIAQHRLITDGDTVVVGLSGGPDSVFLLHFLATQYPTVRLIAAHLDHGWRPESAQDAIFCQTVAERYNVPLICRKMSDLGQQFKFNGSKEEVGRKARRALFALVAQEFSAQRIALAHHADDQQETFFIRMLRGASITGLTGIKPNQGLYVRPLLNTPKQRIMEFLAQEQIPYLTDQTNSSEIYLRNRIRLKVIPALKEIDSRFEQTFANTHARLQETEEYLESQTNQTFAMIAQFRENYWIIDTKKYALLHRVMRERIVLVWLCKAGVTFPVSHAFLQEIDRFLVSERGGIHAIKNDWHITKRHNFANITKASRRE